MAHTKKKKQKESPKEIGVREMIRRTEKAFGGCKKCFGKGYSTTTIRGELSSSPCSCGRGKQVQAVIHQEVRNALHDLRDNVEFYVARAYGEGKAKKRTAATGHIKDFIDEVLEKIPKAPLTN